MPEEEKRKPDVLTFDVLVFGAVVYMRREDIIVWLHEEAEAFPTEARQIVKALASKLAKAKLRGSQLQREVSNDQSVRWNRIKTDSTGDTKGDDGAGKAPSDARVASAFRRGRGSR